MSRRHRPGSPTLRAGAGAAVGPAERLEPWETTRCPKIIAAVTLALVLTARPAFSGQVLFVINADNRVGEYDATTGKRRHQREPLSSARDSTTRIGLAVDGNNHLFVTNFSNNTVGQYNATTGATINSAFINGQGLNLPGTIVLDGK